MKISKRLTKLELKAVWTLQRQQAAALVLVWWLSTARCHRSLHQASKWSSVEMSNHPFGV
jgi:hypothetical protein